MNEPWAAVIVSAITGGFGLLGIICTQFAAKQKSRRIEPVAEDIMMASEWVDRPARLDYLAAIRMDLHVVRDNEREAHRDIKEMIRDMTRDMKDGFDVVHTRIDSVNTRIDRINK